MIEIGLTGGIGAGKSTVAAALVDRGAVLIDADLIVRDLQQPGAPVFEAMRARWGDSIIAADGTLDRAAVAEIVFADDAELEALNEIVHPAVAVEMNSRREALAGTESVVIFDIPLLVRPDGESVADRYAHLDGIVVVDVDAEIAVDRLVAHRGFSEIDARNRIANQAGRDERRAVADRVIDNSGALSQLEAQVDEVWAWISGLGSVTPCE